MVYVVLHLTAYNLLIDGGGIYNYTRNLFCDLFLTYSQNENIFLVNLLAIVGHVFLSCGMILFFYLIPKIFKTQNVRISIVKWTGMLSMITFIFLSSGYHDLFVTITGSIGLIALIPLFIQYIKSRDYLGLHAYYGGFCIVLSLFVFFIFESKYLIEYLPVIQIISFILDSVWVFWVCWIVWTNSRNLNKAF